MCSTGRTKRSLLDTCLSLVLPGRPPRTVQVGLPPPFTVYIYTMDLSQTTDKPTLVSWAFQVVSWCTSAQVHPTVGIGTVSTYLWESQLSASSKSLMYSQYVGGLTNPNGIHNPKHYKNKGHFRSKLVVQQSAFCLLEFTVLFPII